MLIHEHNLKLFFQFVFICFSSVLSMFQISHVNVSKCLYCESVFSFLANIALHVKKKKKKNSLGAMLNKMLNVMYGKQANFEVNRLHDVTKQEIVLPQKDRFGDRCLVPTAWCIYLNLYQVIDNAHVVQTTSSLWLTIERGNEHQHLGEINLFLQLTILPIHNKQVAVTQRMTGRLMSSACVQQHCVYTFISLYLIIGNEYCI